MNLRQDKQLEHQAKEEAYKKIIDIQGIHLSEPTKDRIINTLMKEHPNIFISIYNSAGCTAWLDNVKELALSGKKIQAIKMYRENTGVGLKEAKEAVEAMPESAIARQRQARYRELTNTLSSY